MRHSLRRANFASGMRAFDAGYAAALGEADSSPCTRPDLDHALKEVDRAALATARTAEQVLDVLAYVISGKLPGFALAPRRADPRPPPGRRAVGARGPEAYRHEHMFVRWDDLRIERDLRLPGVGDGAIVRTFDAPEAMGINFHEVRARSALNRVPGARFGFN